MKSSITQFINMKKVILGLIAMAFSLFSNAQSNTKNKFDYVGKLHNEIVDTYLKNNFSYQNSEELCNQINEIASKNNNFISIVGSDNFKADSKTIDLGINDFKNYFKNIINNQPMSENGKQNSQKLVNYLFESGFSSNKVSYQELFDYIVSFENEIIISKNLTDLDKQVLLSSSSVARYSLYFWNNHFKNNNENQTTSSQGRSWWQWVIVGACDVAGGIAGAPGSPALAVTTAASASTAAYTMTNPKTK